METRTLFTLLDLPKAVYGTVTFSASAARLETRAVSSVAIDSREVLPGALFVALPGAVTDGHNFVTDALDRGAVAALVCEDRTPPSGEWSIPVVCVPDTLIALQQLAAWYARSELSSVTRIGVTGSNGKTTTKEMIAAILRTAGGTSASEGNLNSETGVPLAIFATDPASRFAVFEMAMSNPGEMAPLAEIVRPQYAVITNIGTAHIGLMGTRDAIAREKKAVSACFDGSQYLFVPEADDYTEFLRSDVAGTVVPFGPDTQHARVDAESDPTRVFLTVDTERYEVPFGGYHNGLNALAAIALAKILELSPEAIRAGLSAVTLPPGRSEVLQVAHDRVVLNDSYNANPDSLEASLHAADVLRRRRGAKETGKAGLVVVLGAMKELGEHSRDAHRRAISEACRIEPDLVCLVGGEEWDLPEREAGAVHIRTFPTVEVLQRQLLDLLVGGETILLKGSRSIELERLIPLLQNPESRNPAGSREDSRDA